MKRIVISTALAGLLALGVVSPAEAVGGCVKGSHSTGYSVPCNPRPARVWTPPRTVVVHKGDTLWNLSVRYLGNGHWYPLIQKANRLRSTTIRVGQRLVIPSLPLAGSANYGDLLNALNNR